MRILAGAAVLIPLAALSRPARAGAAIVSRGAGPWILALALVTYAAAFSWAYTTLSVGTGALILFASVQITMIGAAVAGGERLAALGWLGGALAMGGLVLLLLPGLSAPDPRGALAMAIAGAAWGFYSLRGKKAGPPLEATAGSFLRGVALVLIAAAIAWTLAGTARAHITWQGVVFAALSGGVTSGLGYAVWYRALKHLSVAAAALVQLAVPVIAAVAGALLLHEPPTARQLIASVTVLGGIGLALSPRLETASRRSAA